MWEGVSTGALLMDEPPPPPTERGGKSLGLPASTDLWLDLRRARDSSSTDEMGEELAWATDLEELCPPPRLELRNGSPDGSKGSKSAKLSKMMGFFRLPALDALAVLLLALWPEGAWPSTSLSPWKVKLFFLVGLGVHARMSSCVSCAMGWMLRLGPPLEPPARDLAAAGPPPLALPPPCQGSLSSTRAGNSALPSSSDA
mmetsp:Transcript_29793/g.63293  ORF Transcript_29793/g.63293 Transcript_29793/m.63293 type:complete len:200 (-) Transcript_29793:1246-1845(-)